MTDNQQIIDTSTALATSKAATYGGSVVGAASAWIGSIDLAFWASIIIGLGGFLMNWYYARQKNKRDEELHKKLMGEDNHDKQD
ncbi:MULTISPECIES: holin [Acinetobacter calcoaceticus/baumannii complex]|uniref:holin n=1 Tax=Acinetobacter calcoaceticus/baumannii complex TaxID=909768 RepID=UPI0005FB07D2|nr:MULTISPECIES: holin [Acinetobacter calcoaceticus/baumannii complex]